MIKGDTAKRLLLISNSTMHRRGYLDHCVEEICKLLGQARHVAFIPYAMYDRDAYAAKAQARFKALGYQLEPVHHAAIPRQVLEKTDAVFIGGGNTFRLLKALYDHDLLGPIRERIASGVPYIGSSAGSIVAGPTIKTTKDMPIVQPESFDSLGLMPFQISPHFLDPDPQSTHMGETQEERIMQFLEENEAPVVGLREGGVIRMEGESVQLLGSTGARIFRRGHQAVEAKPGEQIGAFVQHEGTHAAQEY